MRLPARAWERRNSTSIWSLILALVAALAMSVTVASPARADPASDRAEQLRYATETINLSYSQFMARKLDFSGAGCNADTNLKYPEGCAKPVPYNSFNWTTDGCSFIQGLPNPYRNLFRAPCELHDFGYRNFGKELALAPTESQRAIIDARFLTEMRQMCTDSFPNWRRLGQLLTCRKFALAMYNGVRTLSYWNGRTPPVTPPPPSPGTPVADLDSGDSTGIGKWYVIGLSGFPANSPVTVTCRDSVAPAGFHTATLQTDASGAAFRSDLCMGLNGRDHWYTANNVESAHIRW